MFLINCAGVYCTTSAVLFIVDYIMQYSQFRFPTTINMRFINVSRRGFRGGRTRRTPPCLPLYVIPKNKFTPPCSVWYFILLRPQVQYFLDPRLVSTQTDRADQVNDLILIRLLLIKQITVFNIWSIWFLPYNGPILSPKMAFVLFDFCAVFLICIENVHVYMKSPYLYTDNMVFVSTLG